MLSQENRAMPSDFSYTQQLFDCYLRWYLYPTPKINSHYSLSAGCVIQPIASGWKLEIGQDSP